ncbi:MAG TPA: hypothetical protein VGP47_09980 [Parachlamydiaceae bacterium]|nr:hypothetical protein [Parachlamydiaceae bacterium]
MNAITTTINKHYNACCKAINAATTEKMNINIKKDEVYLGEKIYENPDREKIISEVASYSIGWHGTHHPLVANQIDRGRFENQGEDIYFSREIWDAQFFGSAKSNKEAFKTNEKSDPVTLRIASKAGIGINVYNKIYFNGQTQEPVHILEAYRQNADAEDEFPSSTATAISIIKAARDTYYQEIGKLE